MKILTSIVCFLCVAGSAMAQCESWIDSPQQEEAENAHVVYRQHVKNQDYDAAFAQWKVAFEIAPAADGRRDSHFRDGIEIYKYKFNNSTSENDKENYRQKVIELYEQLEECVANGAIKYKSCSDQECINERVGQIMGRQAFDMYYTLLTPREQTYAVFKESMKLAGNESEYIILKPMADIMVYRFTNNKMTAEEVRADHAALTQIAEYNINNNEQYGQYYAQAKASMDGSIEAIESSVYDCAYFIDKLKPDYDADPENIDVIQNIIVTLKKQDCPEDEPFLIELEEKYEKYAAEYNAAKQAEFEANNPSFVAKKCYDEGDYNCAIEKYKEAIEKEADPEKQASYYFSMASIQFRKLNAYSAARDNAYKAANLKGGWGRPYMLIGDMYAKSSSNCGKGPYEHGLAVLAAIDKWSYAKSIDESVAAEANRNIARYSEYIPPKDEAFMMGKSEGAKEQVGCWIGESVTLRVK